MATSSAMSTSNQYIKYTISVTPNSQSIADNTSNVTVQVRFYRTNTGYTSYGTGTVYCKINGTQYTASVTPSQKITNSGIVLFTKTLNISHGSDGTKTLTCSAWINHDVVTSKEQSYSQALSTIYRASEPSVVALFKMGETITISIDRKSSSFTHTLKYTFGGTTATIATGVGESYRWKVPDLASKCNNALTGTVTITCITYNGSSTIGTKTCEATLGVPTKSTPTFSATSVVMGNSVTVYTNRGSTNFTHTLEFVFANKTVETIKDVGNSTIFTPSLNLAEDIPNDTSGKVTVKCTTYNGKAELSTVSVEFTATVPNNETTKPTASWTLAPSVSLPSAFSDLYIQGKTGVKATFTASPTYSPIDSYKLTADGRNFFGNPATSSVFTRDGNFTITGTVTDKRGFSRTLSEDVTVYPYSAPAIEPASTASSIICERSKQDGTYDDAGTYLHIKCKIKCSPVKVNGVRKNFCSLQYQYKPAGGSWSDPPLTLLDGADTSTENCDVKLPDVVSQTDKTYTIRLIVKDTIGSETPYEFHIATADVTLHLGEGGYGVAVGKYSEGSPDNKLFECAFNAIFNENVHGRVYGLGGLPSIPIDADLNDPKYMEFGCYAIKQTTTAETIKNLPPYITPSAGIVRVYSATGISTGDWLYIAQEYTPFNCRGCYRRLLHKAGNDAEWEVGSWIAVGGVDSVIESGTITTDGVLWYYKKWYNGTAECWASRNLTIDATAQWGSMYGGSVPATGLPFTFREPPVCHVSVNAPSSTFFVVSGSSSTVTNTPAVTLCRPTSVTGVNVNVLYSVHGRWK